MKTKRLKHILIFISPLVIGWIAIFIGAYDVSPTMVLKILFNEIVSFANILDISEKAIIIDIRLPRVILAGLVGIALSSSGVTLQGIFRNPLVDPFILGISAGAAFGCAISVGFLANMPIQVMAFVFGILSVLLTYSIAKIQGEVSRLPLILSGVIISAFFQAMVSIVKFIVDPHKLQSIVFWLMGSFSLANWSLVKISTIGIGLSLLPILLMRWRLNVMSMGEDEAKTLGVNVRRDRIIFIVSSTIAVSIAVSVSGIIGWVGLMVPHLMRMMVGPDHKSLVPLSMAGGATFMIFADTVARSLTNFDIPVGIITAVSGAPFFVYLMKKGGKESWGR
ncbi:iron(III) ABC transporter permease [Dissulfurispira thermophila]|uniref:Iron(III) ABC transporter permease n=1 Tax=Dissulfurispira thermophila TaxID=2715679 RepID=A0A7G1H1X0_9BACT|nr:iron ABC transporter permease [Dissulfurispira thermophila]BCB95946.1 iron(III) ABC transporter permease [Dissulfurispira thermophila]